MSLLLKSKQSKTNFIFERKPELPWRGVAQWSASPTSDYNIVGLNPRQGAS
jgi:hypothetical protein